MNRSLIVKQAIVKVFRDKEEEQHLISNISLVRDHQDQAFHFDGGVAAMYDVDEEDDYDE